MLSFWIYNCNCNWSFRNSRPELFCKKSALINFAKFAGNRLCQGLFFNKVADLEVCDFIKKEILVQVFSCEFCQISKNTFSYRTPLVAASDRSEHFKVYFYLAKLFWHRFKGKP